MAYKTKKVFTTDIFYNCSQLMGRNVTEISEATKKLSNFISADGDSEFSDGVVYDTYNSLSNMFQSMYNDNVEDQINLGKKKGKVYSDDTDYSTELGVVCESIVSYSDEIIYRFGDLGGEKGEVPENFLDALALVSIKGNLTKEEYDRYQILLNKTKYSDPVAKLSRQEKREFISLYEKLYPSDAEKMNYIGDVFADDGYPGYEDDVVNIKLLVYTAEDPYKSVYIDNLSPEIKGELHDKVWPRASAGVFYIDVDGWDDYGNSNKTAEMYASFFHESSHCIDYFKGGKVSFTSRYKKDEVCFKDVLENDIKTKIEFECDKYLKTVTGLTEKDKNLVKAYVEDSIMNQIDYKKYGTPDFSQIVNADSSVKYLVVSECYNEVKRNINAKMVGSVSDTYGGLTGNTFEGSTLHESLITEREDDTIEYRVYWVEGDVNDDGTNLYINLDNGETVCEDIDLSKEEQWSDSDLSERVIMSNGDVKYNDSIPAEFFANHMEAVFSRNHSDLKGYEKCETDTKEYYDEMLREMY